MKTITTTSTNKRGITKTFTVSATHTQGNFYALKIESDFEIAEASNGHAAITDSAIIRDYTLNAFKLKRNNYAQVVVTPRGGTKKDRYTLQLDANTLIDRAEA